MVVVAFVGSLAAVALPASRYYTIRAKVSEDLLSMGAAKTAVTQNVQNGQAFANTWIVGSKAIAAGLNNNGLAGAEATTLSRNGQIAIN